MSRAPSADQPPLASPPLASPPLASPPLAIPPPRRPPLVVSRPRVSVVLPVRDAAATLDAALKSLARQTLRDFEVVAVDDGSTDATPRILRSWTARDRRFRALRGPGRGIVPALQRGLAAARAPIVARMDADDLCRRERLAVQLAFLQRTGLDGCGTQVRCFPDSAVTGRAAEYAAWLNAMTDWQTVTANIFVECPLAHPSFVFRAEALASVGGYRDRGWPEDYDLLLRLWRAGRRFASVPRALLAWRHGPDRLSRSHPAYSLDAFRACRVHHLRRSLLAGKEGVVVWGAGPTGKRLALEFLRQGVAVAAFVEVDPRKIGQRIHGAPVLDACGTDACGAVLHVGAVARSKGRRAVRDAASRAGLEEGRNFVAMA